AGSIFGSVAIDIDDNGLPISPPAALTSGGETTVTVKGNGKGGRNQELAVAAAASIAGYEGIVGGSIATDGVDGPTDAAGASAEGTTVKRGKGSEWTRRIISGRMTRTTISGDSEI